MQLLYVISSSGSKRAAENGNESIEYALRSFEHETTSSARFNPLYLSRFACVYQGISGFRLSVCFMEIIRSY